MKTIEEITAMMGDLVNEAIGVGGRRVTEGMLTDGTALYERLNDILLEIRRIYGMRLEADEYQKIKRVDITRVGGGKLAPHLDVLRVKYSSNGRYIVVEQKDLSTIYNWDEIFNVKEVR